MNLSAGDATVGTLLLVGIVWFCRGTGRQGFYLALCAFLFGLVVADVGGWLFRYGLLMVNLIDWVWFHLSRIWH